MSLRPRQPAMGRMNQARARMAPGGRRWSESPIPRPGVRRVRRMSSGYGWTQRATISTTLDPEKIRGIGYGNGMWVGVGLGAGVWTATDPAGTWTYVGEGTIEAVDYDEFYCVAYGDGVWVAGGNAGKLYTATNPAGTWTSRSVFATDEPVESVVYAGGIWVANAVNGSNDNQTYTATDPTGTWTHRTGLDSAVGIASIGYGAGVWVAFGGFFDVTYTATDPTGTWTERSTEALPTGGYARDVAYAGGKWVVFVQSDGTRGYVAWTADPTTTGGWTKVLAGFTSGEDIRAGGVGAGVWVAMGPDASSGEARATATDPTVAAAV